MNRRALNILFCVFAIVFTAGEAFGQLMPERRFVRKGNRDYARGDYAESEIDYLQARSKDSLSFAASYNLGNAYYRQGRFEEAAAAFAKPGPLGLTPELLAHNFYNAGNVQFQQRKLEEAIESYKQSLRINPGDTEAKFNLAYAKKMLEKQQQEQNDQNDDDNDQQDNKDNQNNQNNQDNKDQQDNDQQNDQQDQQNQQDQQDDRQDNDQQNQDDNDRNNDRNQPQGDGQQERQPQGMTREEAEQMLQAIEMGDEKTKEKVDAQKGRAVGGSGRNW